MAACSLTSRARKKSRISSPHCHTCPCTLSRSGYLEAVGDQYTSPPWDVPIYRIATEVGTKADFVGAEWWVEGTPDSNFTLHKQFFFGSINPEETWEEFIDRRETDSQFFGDVRDPGFLLDDVFGWFAQNGFAAAY
ncbi:MAG: hypothetical protein IT430_08200 [Phycisphaerales bacterium]|nr:hypothetical protein [Phycisphaerales bacterium]